MKRDLGALEAGVHDVLVVGAGIYGACIARDAAQRGLKVALIERGDFGAATSHNSLKLLHGGLRYLQHLDVPRLRQSAREQRAWLAIAPHLVRPLAFVLPTWGHGARGPEVMRAALWLHGLLGRGGAGAPVPRSHVLSRQECLARVPGLAAERLTGGAVWYEAQMLNADRLLLECVLAAATDGAVVANHVVAEGFLGSAQEVTGVAARDALSGAPLTLRARVTVNACGPFAAALLRRLQGARAAPFGGLAQAMNLVTRPLPFAGHALGVSSRRRSDSLVPRPDGRLYFITPWQGCAVVGTTHLPYQGDPDDFRATEAAIQAFLEEINEAYPPAQLRRADVLYCYAGLTPAGGGSSGGEVRRRRRGQVIDHARGEGVQGLVSVQGVKYTTARLVAEGVVDLVLAKLGRAPVPCRSALTPLPGARGFASMAALVREAPASGLDGAELARLLQAYGTRWREVLAGADPIGVGDLFRARVRHAVRHEMAVRLDDVLLRRVEHAALGLLDEERLAGAAAIMAAELGWSPGEQRRQLEAMREELRRHHAATPAPARRATPASTPGPSSDDLAPVRCR